MTSGVYQRAADLPKGWNVCTGFFRTVIGYSEATDLLNDPRMHAHFVGLFEAAGARSGPLWEIMSASLLSINGHDHKRFRGVIAGRFTPRAVNTIRPLARDTAHELIDGFAHLGRCELMSEFAARYVATTTCAFLGLPLDEVASLARTLDSLADATKDLHQNLDEVAAGVVRLVDYTSAVLTERPLHPTGDILSAIAEAVGGGDMPELVASGLVAGLLTAGYTPTINQLGIMVDVLSREPKIWRALGQGTIDAVPVVEEVLRFRSTNRGMNRRVAESFAYRGVDLDEGTQVLFDLATANHDPRRFANPDRFDLDANRGSHLAFGFGPHFCLGAALARAQLQEALRALTSRITCPQILRSAETTGLSDLTDEIVQRHVEHASPKLPGSGGLMGPSFLDVAFKPLAGTSAVCPP